jgi:quinol monooxygenase YgiN
MEKFGMFGKITAVPGQRDALAAILLEAAALMESVDGCEKYIVNLAVDEPDAILVNEIWRDAAAHQASLTLESTRALIGRGRPLIAGVEPVRLRPIGGKGL